MSMSIQPVYGCLVKPMARRGRLTFLQWADTTVRYGFALYTVKWLIQAWVCCPRIAVSSW